MAWTPEPNESLSDEHRNKGIMIGDGIIKADGSFWRLPQNLKYFHIGRRFGHHFRPHSASYLLVYCPAVYTSAAHLMGTAYPGSAFTYSSLLGCVR